MFCDAYTAASHKIQFSDMSVSQNGTKHYHEDTKKDLSFAFFVFFSLVYWSFPEFIELISYTDRGKHISKYSCLLVKPDVKRLEKYTIPHLLKAKAFVSKSYFS